MKRILCMLLALMLLVGCIFTFASCNTEDGKEEDNKQEGSEGDKKEEEGEDQKDVVIPEDYQVYDNGTLSFAYPKAWAKQEGSTVILQHPSNGNNITVVYEAKTDMYENMTVASFNSTLKPVYEAMGITVSNVKISKQKTNGLDIVQISHNTKTEAASMKQTQYVVTLGDKTYTVTVTEVVSDAKLVSTVLETLKGVEK